MSTPPRRATPPQTKPMSTRTSQRHPLLSASTFTFLASWRGQLLICTVLIVLGAIYVIVSKPVQAWAQRRREQISRVREAELMSLENDRDVEDKKDVIKERGREKKKETKKRKGSLLKVPNGSATDSSVAAPSSIESSPAPYRSPPPQISNRSFRRVTPSSSSPSPQKASELHLPARSPPVSAKILEMAEETGVAPSSTSARQGDSESSSISLQPQSPLAPAIKLTESSVPPMKAKASLSPSPFTIPLPQSPMPGPSRVSISASEDEQESVSDSGPSGSDSRKSAASSGFSIIPEEGYLPVQSANLLNSKKKKRKGKVPAPLADMERRDPSTETDQPASPATALETSRTPLEKPVPPETPRRHSRKASLSIRPPNADAEQLGQLLDERDRTIDHLRAEIGLAKAEEAKARESASRSKQNEDRIKENLDRAKRGNQKTENEARRREAELATRFNQLGSAYAATLHRLNALETMLRDTGISVPPPPSPGMMPQHFGSTTPLHPSSPYGVPFPSPLPGSGPPRPYMGYPSPGMYPSPMLHPLHHAGHPHSPSPFRRTSTSDSSVDILAGPLTPGLPTVPSPYPMEMGVNGMNGSMPIASRGVQGTSGAVPVHGTPASDGTGMTPEQRRQAIESTVFKKKVVKEHESENGVMDLPRRAASPESSEQGTGLAEGIEGLGMGAIERVQDSFVHKDPSHAAEHVGHDGHDGETDNEANEVLSVTLSPPDLSHSLAYSHSHHSSSSPSPKPRIITPAELDTLHRQPGSSTPDSVGRIVLNGMTNGHDLLFDPSQITEHGSAGMKGIRMMVDPEGRGNIYFRDGEEADFAEGRFVLDHLENGEGQPNGVGVSAEDQADGSQEAGPAGLEKMTGNEEEEEEALAKTYIPVFASLAHTPEQVDEIRRMSMAVKTRERGLSAGGRSMRSVGGSGGSVGSGGVSPARSQTSLGA